MLILFYNFIFHYLEITQAKWDPLYVMYDFVRFIFQSTDGQISHDRNNQTNAYMVLQNEARIQSLEKMIGQK